MIKEISIVINPLNDEKFHKIAKKISDKAFMMEHCKPENKSLYAEDLVNMLNQAEDRFTYLVTQAQKGL